MNNDIQERLKEAERTFEGSPGNDHKPVSVPDQGGFSAVLREAVSPVS